MSSKDGWNRRDLLAGLAVGAVAGTVTVGAGVVTGCAPTETADDYAPSGGDSGVPAFELEEIDLDELQAGMASGRFTARGITEAYLQRIGAVDREGPQLRSVIETNPDALQIADELDRERAAGSVRGPLHGIPILLKDNIATADRNTTTAGSHALEGSIPAVDSFVAARLRTAGAVLLGKANLSEWANFRSDKSSSGWSGRGGQCRNPFALDRNPCGSSSGSGAATSASLCAVAIGTETNGSILCPSNANGLVGIKPTVGLVSRTRIVPISHTQDTAGPMARTVRDAAAVLGALVGVDPEDSATTVSEGRSQSDYLQFLDPDGARARRIGFARDYLGFDPRVDRLIESAVEALRELGAEIVDPVEIATRREMSRPSYQVLLYEFKAGINAYLAALGPDAPVKSLEEIIRFNEQNADKELPYFGQDILELAQEKGDLTTPEYRKSLADALRMARAEGIDQTMDDHRLDAIIAPTGGPAWVTDLVNGDHFSGGSSSAAAIAGYPNITVPMGTVQGLPVGISIFGRAWSEPKLLAIAYAFEQATKHRVTPKFLPSLDFG